MSFARALAPVLIASGLFAVARPAVAGAVAPGAMPRPDRYIGVIFGSVHVGNSTLNDVNPGLTYGRRWTLTPGGLDLYAEGGVFYNSYREVSPLALIGVSQAIGRIGAARFSIGAGTGIAYYKRLSETLQRTYGIPNVGGFIPLATLTLSAQVGRLEYRLTTVPAAGDVQAIVNFSVAWHF
ncbi:MAG: hypothetical protein KGN33_04785 [Paracoccaceae bacterium]|nr:hypothetical protein [Paracoccaceae bacterium]